MKYLVIALALLFSVQSAAQKSAKNKKTFVRVYSDLGARIAKGNILSISDTSLQLLNLRDTFNIPFNDIGLIKTKRSVGHSIGVGAGAGAASLGFLGMASASSDSFFTSGDMAGIGAVTGLFLGTAIGAIGGLAKNSKTYEINGDIIKWNAFKESITGEKPENQVVISKE